MSWSRLDDGLHDHPRFIDLDLAAVGLWTLCLSYAGSRRDPLIPRGLPRRFGAEDDSVEALVRAGLWEPAEDGWIIHHWQDYQPVGSSTERTRRYRDRHRDVDVTVTTPSPLAAAAVTSGSPVPVPVPVPEPARVRASRWLGRGEEPVEVYAQRCVELGLGTPSDDELRVISVKSKAAIGRGETLADVLTGCRAAAVKNQAGLLDRLIGDAKRARLGIVQNDRAATEGPPAPRPPRVEERRQPVDWEEQRAGVALVGDVLKGMRPTEPTSQTAIA